MFGYRVPHFPAVFVFSYVMVLMERATSAVHGRGREGLKKPVGGGTYVGMSVQGLRMSHSFIPWRLHQLSRLHGASLLPTRLCIVFATLQAMPRQGWGWAPVPSAAYQAPRRL
jgi:hypothetical protein